MLKTHWHECLSDCRNLLYIDTTRIYGVYGRLADFLADPLYGRLADLVRFCKISMPMLGRIASGRTYGPYVRAAKYTRAFNQVCNRFIHALIDEIILFQIYLNWLAKLAYNIFNLFRFGCFRLNIFRFTYFQFTTKYGRIRI